MSLIEKEKKERKRLIKRKKIYIYYVYILKERDYPQKSCNLSRPEGLVEIALTISLPCALPGGVARSGARRYYCEFGFSESGRGKRDCRTGPRATSVE